jgi:hypothetical protein
MMSQSLETDVFKQKFEEERARQKAEAIKMTFEGFPCEVVPIPYGLFVTSGRMPDHLTRFVLAEDAQTARRATEEMTGEEIVEGERFMRHVVCKALVSPRVVEVEPIPEGGYLYADLMETAPKFVGAVFRWIMRGCPMPKKEKGAEVLGVEDLENFPEGAAGQSGANARDTGESSGEATDRPSPARRKRTRRG